MIVGEPECKSPQTITPYSDGERSDVDLIAVPQGREPAANRDSRLVRALSEATTGGSPSTAHGRTAHEQGHERAFRAAMA